MANPTVAAGGNGVAGNVNFATRTRTGAYDTTSYTTNGDLAVSDNHAVRRSVSRTHGTSTASGVFSETQSLRFAYVGVEADSPALDAIRTAA